ncbi:MAG: glycosyltransferase [Calditrichae bacterium]|nr:glycosyltransferase [Calditrichia bacterium]
MSIKVSVRIITYNHEKWIRQCLQSVLDQQTTFPFNIIVNDDYSPDNTFRILQEIQNNNPDRIKLNKPEINLGVFENSKRALASCDGEFVAFLDGDDYWHDPLKLQQQVDFLEKNPHMAMVHSGFNYFIENKNQVVPFVNRNKKIPSGQIYEELLKNNFIKTCTTLVRRDVLLKFDDYDLYKSQNFRMADYPRWLSIAKKMSIGYLNDSLSTYRILDDSASRPESFEKHKAYVESIYKVKSYFISNYGCSEKVKNAVEENHFKRLLILAYKYKKPHLAAQYYKNLKNLRNIKFKNHIKYILYLSFSYIPFLKRNRHERN